MSELREKIVSAILAYPPETMTEAEDATDAILALIQKEQGWRSIPSLGGRYEAHPCGAIRQKDGNIVGQWLSNRGYVRCRVGSQVDGSRKILDVHRLIAEVFCANPDNLPCVNHIDNNPSNNTAANLEWCTQAQNMEHARKQGRLRGGSKTAQTAHRALTKAQVLRIWELKAQGFSHVQISERIPTNKTTVSKILNRKFYADWSPTPPQGEDG